MYALSSCSRQTFSLVRPSPKLNNLHSASQCLAANLRSFPMSVGTRWAPCLSLEKSGPTCRFARFLGLGMTKVPAIGPFVKAFVPSTFIPSLGILAGLKIFAAPSFFSTTNAIDCDADGGAPLKRLTSLLQFAVSSNEVPLSFVIRFLPPAAAG